MEYQKQIIHGQPPSKSNAYRIVNVHGHVSLCKTPATKKYEESFFMQCSLRNANIDKRFKLTMDVYFQSDRPDIDNSCKAVLDCLQTIKAIKNDRLCSELHVRKLIDKENPRIEFVLETQQ